MLLKHDDWVDIIATRSGFFCTTPRVTAKEVRGHLPELPTCYRQVDYIGSIPLSVRSKYALGYVDTPFGLTQVLPCHSANQAATTRGLEKLSTMDRCPHW